MNLKLGLAIVILLSAAVFSGGVALEHAAEPGAAETVLGINPESPILVTTAIVVSALLAVTLSMRSTFLVLAIAGSFGLIFAIVDVLEIFHQFQEQRPSLIAIATLATLFHLAITVLAIVLMRRASAGILRQG
jgi:hypothetical protein